MENTSDSLTLRLFYFAWKSENEFVIKWLIIIGRECGEKIGQERGEKIGQERGEKIGKKQGIRNEQRRIVNSLKRKGKTMDEIAYLTGIHETVVKKLLGEERYAIK